MISKRSSGCDLNDVALRNRLRSNIVHIFLSNTVSGVRVASLLIDANAARAAVVSDLSDLGGTQHVHRNLLAKCLRRSLWPRPTISRAKSGTRTAERKTPQPCQYFCHTKCCSLSASTLPLRTSTSYWTRTVWILRRETFFKGGRREIGLGGVDTIGIGLWLDGVSTKWVRTESLDMVTMGLPGLTGRWNALRVPLFVVHHSWVLKHRTMDDVLGLLRSSMDQAVVGVMPQKRHEGSAWAATDVWRKRRAGRQLHCRGLVCQVTGDWKDVQGHLPLPPAQRDSRRLSVVRSDSCRAP